MIRQYGSALALLALATGVTLYNQTAGHELLVLWGTSELVGPSPVAQARVTETILWGLAGVAGVLGWRRGVRERRLRADETDIVE